MKVTVVPKRSKVDKSVTPEPIKNPLARFGILGLASGFGLGYAPFASGTFGSVLGIPFGLFIMRLSDPWALGVTAAFFVLASLISDRAGRHWGQMDSGRIVIDEILGQAIAMMGLRAYANPENMLPPVAWVLISFLLFRVLDILKPYPARSFDRIPTGWGAVLDDVAAGLYAALFLMGFSKIAGDMLS